MRMRSPECWRAQRAACPPPSPRLSLGRLPLAFPPFLSQALQAGGASGFPVSLQGWTLRVAESGQQEQVCFQDKTSSCKQFPNWFFSRESTLPLGERWRLSSGGTTLALSSSHLPGESSDVVFLTFEDKSPTPARGNDHP